MRGEWKGSMVGHILYSHSVLGLLQLLPTLPVVLKVKLSFKTLLVSSFFLFSCFPLLLNQPHLCCGQATGVYTDVITTATRQFPKTANL